MPLSLDPARLHLQPGLVLVRLDEVLGGTTAGGIFLSADLVDGGGRKDTAHGIVERMGPLPARKHEILKEGRPHVAPDRMVPNRSGQPWPPEAFPVKCGDRIFFPRDLPLVFFWEEQRYGLVAMGEIFLVADPDVDISFPPRAA